MTVFNYIAIDKVGRRQKGTIEAENARQSRQLLREQSLMPVKIEEAVGFSYKASPATGEAGQSPRIDVRDMIVFTRQLAAMVQSGLPLEKALAALGKQSKKSKIRNILTAVRKRVAEGNSLTNSLAAFPETFSEMYRASIHAGERTGHLGLILEHLADFLDRSYRARQKVVLALLYPAILTVVSLLIIVFLMTFIMPDMIRVFNGAGYTLPLLTRILVVVSNTIQAYGLYILFAVLGAAFFLRRLYRRPEIRLNFDRRILRWPFIKSMAMDYNSARFASTLGMLHESGVPLVNALEVAGAVLTNRHIRERVKEMTQSISEGRALSLAMEQSGVFPPIIVTMAGSGEASGDLANMLARAGDIQQRDLETRIAVLMGLFEPFVLLFMGGIVLLLVVAIILPILHINQLVK